MSPVCPSAHRTRYGGSPFAPLTSSTSPCLVGSSVWRAARMMRSPWCAFIVPLPHLVSVPRLCSVCVVASARWQRLDPIPAEHQVRAERPVFAMDCGWAPALEELGTDVAPLWEVREWRAGGCPQLDLHNASVP